MSHALQLILISQIVKADFNTDVLKLKQRVPDALYNEDVLFMFRDSILFDLFKRIFKELQSYPL
jgi:hypothetical protein